MRALVTGGAGFIGSHLVDRLLAEGAEVRVVDDLSTGRLSNLDAHRGEPRLAVEELDIAAPGERVETVLRGVTHVFHLAALADIVPSIHHPERYYHSNTHGTFRVLEAARQITGIRKLVYAASSSCYGIPNCHPTPEDAPCRPMYPYALTKYLGEQIVAHWGAVYRIPVLSTRFFNVYWPRSRTSGTYGAVFGVFLAQKLAGKPFTIVGDGEQTRDFTYVTDVVDAVYRLAVSEHTGDIVNVGSGKPQSINRLVELLEGPCVHIPKRPGEPDCTHAAIDKLKRLLDWQPQVDFEEGVARMLAHIDDWRTAPVWTPESIRELVADWEKALG